MVTELVEQSCAPSEMPLPIHVSRLNRMSPVSLPLLTAANLASLLLPGINSTLEPVGKGKKAMASASAAFPGVNTLPTRSISACIELH